MWKRQFMPVSPRHPALLPEAGGHSWRGLLCVASLPAGTDRPPLSACLQISYRDMICLTP